MKQFLIGSYAPEGEPSIFGVELDGREAKAPSAVGRWTGSESVLIFICIRIAMFCTRLKNVCRTAALRLLIKTEEGWLLKERLLAGSAPCHLEMTPRYTISSGQQLHGWNDWRISGG